MQETLKHTSDEDGQRLSIETQDRPKHQTHEVFSFSHGCPHEDSELQALISLPPFFSLGYL